MKDPYVGEFIIALISWNVSIERRNVSKKYIESLQSGWIKAMLEQESLVTWSKKLSNFFWDITRYVLRFFMILNLEHSDNVSLS